MTENISGMDRRREIVGDEYLDRAMSRTDVFNAPFQEYLNDHVWGAVWTRGTLSQKARSLAVVSFMIAQKNLGELPIHFRGALQNGWTLEELRELILQAAAYCGAPTAVSAMTVINEKFADEISALANNEA